MKGDTGVKGECGENGVKGQLGYPGYKGEPGAKGVKGDRGFGGNNGQKGDKGMTGEQDPAGSIPLCGGPGWRKVAFIDMTNTSQNCPQGLTLTGCSNYRVVEPIQIRTLVLRSFFMSVDINIVEYVGELGLISGGTCIPLGGITLLHIISVHSTLMD